MKKIIIILLAISLLTSAFAAVSLKERVISDMILSLLSNWHFSPQNLDDDFSEKVYDLYLERMDYNKRFYLQSDINRIAKYRDQLDDQLKAKNFTFYILADTLHDMRTLQVKRIVHELMQEPFDYQAVETLETDPEKLTFCNDISELRDRWRKMLKFQTTLKYLELVEDASAAGDSLDIDTIEYFNNNELIT